MIDKFLEIYDFKMLRELERLLRELTRSGYSQEELRTYVVKKKKELLLEKERERLLREQPCPECGGFLILQVVNSGRRDQTGDSSQSVWSCPKCHYEKFNKEQAKDIFLKLTSKEKGE